MEFIKKLFSFFSALPAFSSLLKKATQTGKIDPVETLDALSSVSPSTKKISDTAMNTVKNGGNIKDVAQSLTQMGEVEVMGQKVNTQTLTTDLKKAGGICSMLGNILEKMVNQSPEEVVNFGNAATNTANWKDFVG